MNFSSLTFRLYFKLSMLMFVCCCSGAGGRGAVSLVPGTPGGAAAGTISTSPSVGAAGIVTGASPVPVRRTPSVTPEASSSTNSDSSSNNGNQGGNDGGNRNNQPRPGALSQPPGSRVISGGLTRVHGSFMRC